KQAQFLPEGEGQEIAVQDALRVVDANFFLGNLAKEVTKQLVEEKPLLFAGTAEDGSDQSFEVLHLTRCGFAFHPIFGFASHNFPPRNLGPYCSSVGNAEEGF